MFKIQKGYDKSNKTFRLPDDLINKLQEIADRHDISVNALVVQCLEYAIANLEEDEKPEK